jgi:hypothetical protein
MVPSPEIPEQDVEPWRTALERLTSDRAHFEALSAESRHAALEYAQGLNVLAFESYLEKIVQSPKKGHAVPAAQSTMASLSPEKRKLLALRLKKHRHVDHGN